MNESSERIAHNKRPIFTDWSSYKGEELVEDLKGLGITYIKPQEDINLRNLIRKYLSERGGEDFTKFALGLCLNFLEMGMMVDKYKDKEYGKGGRHQFLLENRVRIGDKEITLYDLSKVASKLSGNKISQIIMLAQMIDNKDIEEKGKKLKDEIEKIKSERGYFEPGDLVEIDKIARDIINHILQS